MGGSEVASAWFGTCGAGFAKHLRDFGAPHRGVYDRRVDARHPAAAASYPFAAKPVFVDCAWPSSSTVFGLVFASRFCKRVVSAAVPSPAAMPLMVRWMRGPPARRRFCRAVAAQQFDLQVVERVHVGKVAGRWNA